MSPTLLLHDAPAWHWAAGGAAIAIITLTMLYVLNYRLGVSTGFESLCALASRTAYLRRPQLDGQWRWRLPFFGGLIGGGILSSLVSGTWAPFWEMGIFDERIGWGPLGKVAWMFVGGILIGFGTRTAGGCTSGHGIFGLSNLERAGLVSTLAYMGAGVVFTNIVYRVIWVG